MYQDDTSNSFSDNAKALSDLLEEQYNVTEAYVNAQTLLWNAINQRIPENEYNNDGNNNNDTSSSINDDHQDDPSRLTVIAVKRQYQALRNVQMNLKRLHQHHQQQQQQQQQHRHQRQNDTLSRHLALSKRVVRTLSHSPCSWQTNGIALPQPQSTRLLDPTTATSAASATVALAALKASIGQLLQEISEENEIEEKRTKALRQYDT
ncbi:hypothetical protein IV203_032282 [Nitzschia inconspicua]|uniref:Uncharacterized protein n=1 Tax=Nitzschia inconspicua TaxID=303405 RepID=A0A9K3KJT0_9STRA|nr:hypothetical protein IV203_032282 [Nitzschia inconspicua]